MTEHYGPVLDSNALADVANLAGQRSQAAAGGQRASGQAGRQADKANRQPAKKVAKVAKGTAVRPLGAEAGVPIQRVQGLRLGLLIAKGCACSGLMRRDSADVFRGRYKLTGYDIKSGILLEKLACSHRPGQADPQKQSEPQCRGAVAELSSCRTGLSLPPAASGEVRTVATTGRTSV